MLTRISPRCHETLISPAPPTTAFACLTAALVCPTLALALLLLPITLKMGVWTLITAVVEISAEGETAGFPLSALMDAALAEAARVPMPLALPLSVHNFSMEIIVAEAEALPGATSLMRPGEMLTSPPSTSPSPT